MKSRVKLRPPPIVNKLTASIRPEMFAGFNQLKVGIIIKKILNKLLFGIDGLPI